MDVKTLKDETQGTVCVETSDRPSKIGSLNKPCDQGPEQYTIMLLKDYKFLQFPA